MIKKNLSLLNSEKSRFIITGSFNTLLDFILLNIFSDFLHIYYVTSNIMSVGICICISYFLNHYFVFRKKGAADVKTFIMFIAVTGFSSLALQSFIITSMHWLISTPFSRSLFIVGSIDSHPVIELNVVKAFAVLIGMVWNFLFYKKIVFKDKPMHTENEFIG